MDVLWGDFQPINKWKLACDGERWEGISEPKFIIDLTTERRYLNQSKGNIRLKCFGLALVTPIVHSVLSLVAVVSKIVQLVSFSHFWMDKEGEESYSFTGRLKDAGQDLLRVITTPIAFVGLELAAIYGVFSPYDGRKLYASIERVQYNDKDFIFSICFQPEAIEHLFGGNNNYQDSW